jgi:iron complex outermembrane receptor protein
MFHYDIEDLIDFSPSPGEDGLLGTADDTYTFVNLGQAKATGLQLRYDLETPASARFSVSYDGQLAQDQTGRWLDNSPKHMFKLKASTPLFHGLWEAGGDIQYIGDRLSYNRARVAGGWLVNLNLVGRPWGRRLELALGVNNLFDRKFSDPTASFFTPLDRIRQDGRNGSLRLTARF